MKTQSYNPSAIEVEFAKAIAELSKEIQEKVKSNNILSIENRSSEDNPLLVFKMADKDGDKHELVVKFIQRMDS